MSTKYACPHCGDEVPGHLFYVCSLGEHCEECRALCPRCSWKDPERMPKPPPTLLDTAKSLIYGDRAAAYGDYGDEARRLAALWSAFLGVEIKAEQVPALLILLKLCRISQNLTHYDSWLDIAGYAGCAGKLPTINAGGAT